MGLITRLAIYNFRNYSAFTLPLSHPITILTGENGIGKTNFLEALSLLTAGRGLRAAQMRDLVCKEEVSPDNVAPADLLQFNELHSRGLWAVSATLQGEDTPVRISIKGGGNHPGRLIQINGVSEKSSDALLDHLRMLWLTPAMDDLFTGPSANRRRFLDRLVLTLDRRHGQRVNLLERTLRSRNKLIQEEHDDAYLLALEQQLAPVALHVAQARLTLIDRLNAHFISAPNHGFPTARITITGEFEDHFADRLREIVSDSPALDDQPQALDNPFQSLCDEYCQLLRRQRPRDQAAKRTLFGPHRSDFVTYHEPKNIPAAIASSGEQKALLVSLILAHADLTQSQSAQSPVILLDELCAHLDEKRREKLFDRLYQLGLQIFITGTDETVFSSMAGRAQIMCGKRTGSRPEFMPL